MSVQECVNDYYNEDYVSNLEEDEYLYKVKDINGKTLYRDQKLKYIKSYFESLAGTGYKLYAYTKDLRPRQFLLAWK